MISFYKKVYKYPSAPDFSTDTNTRLPSADIAEFATPFAPLGKTNFEPCCFHNVLLRNHLHAAPLVLSFAPSTKTELPSAEMPNP